MTVGKVARAGVEWEGEEATEIADTPVRPGVLALMNSLLMRKHSTHLFPIRGQERIDTNAHI